MKTVKLYREKGAKRISPFFLPFSIINMISGNLSIKYGLKGPNFAIVTACTTGTHNIDDASRLIEYGDSDVMVAGVVVLEEYEHAKARGAKIYAEVSRYRMSGDAYHMTLPSKGGEGAARCMKNTQL